MRALAHMAPFAVPDCAHYEDFYERWTQTQEELMKELHDALGSDVREAELQGIVDRAVLHFEHYYEVKGRETRQDILKVYSPSWRSPLEKAFLWVGGWRPSMAFQLVYALAGQDIEAELEQFLDGVDTPTFASLSSAQLARVSELQVGTIKEEEAIAQEMATLQQSIADLPMLAAIAHVAENVDLGEGGGHGFSSHSFVPAHGDVATSVGGQDEEGEGEDIELRGDGPSAHPSLAPGEPAPACGSDSGLSHDEETEDDAEDEPVGSGGATAGSPSRIHGANGNDVESTMKEKLKTLEDLSIQADSLRKNTLKNVLDVLETVQQAQFLVAAAKLHHALRTIGERLNGDSV